MIIAVASGKGGTGKTLVATSLARSFDDVAFVDADVEGANAHLFLKPDVTASWKAKVEVPVVSADLCTECGACARACQFNALAVVGGQVVIFPELCHSCGACMEVCPSGALAPAEAVLGEIHQGTFADIHPYVFGELAIGQLRSAELIDRVKAAGNGKARVTIVDAPPGTSCSAVRAVRGSDYCLLVTEPTPFGRHDLVASFGMLAEMGVPAGVLINRDGLSAVDIEAVCDAWEVPVLGRLPFDEKIARWTSAGQVVVDRSAPYATFFGALARRLMKTAWAAKPPSAPTEASEDVLRGLSDLHPAGRPTSSAPTCVVISGKGGTGKTMVASSLVAATSRIIAADCDVDAANLHLVLQARADSGRRFHGALVAEVDPAICTGCGVCVERCRFDAIELKGGVATVDELLCEGCGLCSLVCPAREGSVAAVSLVPRLVGTVLESRTPYGLLVRAELAVGAEASGRLVTELRNQAQLSATLVECDSILMDGPPGTGCPVNASVVDTDLGVVVTEPGVSARHDLDRALSLLRFLGVPAVVVINKCDINEEERRRVSEVAAEHGVPVIAEIPFDRTIVDALAAGRPPVVTESCSSRELLCRLVDSVQERLQQLSVAAEGGA